MVARALSAVNRRDRAPSATWSSNAILSAPRTTARCLRH